MSILSSFQKYDTVNLQENLISSNQPSSMSMSNKCCITMNPNFAKETLSIKNKPTKFPFLYFRFNYYEIQSGPCKMKGDL